MNSMQTARKRGGLPIMLAALAGAIAQTNATTSLMRYCANRPGSFQKKQRHAGPQTHTMDQRTTVGSRWFGRYWLRMDPKQRRRLVKLGLRKAIQ